MSNVTQLELPQEDKDLVDSGECLKTISMIIKEFGLGLSEDRNIVDTYIGKINE